jgi:Organic radical activating enzymes
LSAPDLVRSQVFQNAVCNWRCWYCFVPFSLLSANPQHSAWLSAAELIDLYLAEESPPPILDLTGGQPDLVPEWVVWMMEELRSRGLEKTVYLWSDDNLSNDFFWRFLTDSDRECIASYPLYGRVCCFKGFNEESFVFNTCAAPELFAQQFVLMKRLLDLGIDIYGYVTFTSPTATGIDSDMSRFVDSLQALDPMLPLRVVPLEIRMFTPVVSRLNDEATASMQHQQIAVERWQKELDARFSNSDRLLPITEVPLKSLRNQHHARSGVSG